MLANAGSRGFWFTFASSRDRHVGAAFDAAHEIAGWLRRAADEAGRPVAVETADPLVLSGLARAARRLGMDFRADARARAAAAAADVVGGLRAAALLALAAAGLARSVAAAAPLRRVAPERADVLVFTLFHAGRRLPDLDRSVYRDVYFGDLPRILSQQGRSVVLSGHCAQGEAPVVAHLRTRPDACAWLRPAVVDATPSDLAAALGTALAPGIRVPPMAIGDAVDLAPLIRRDCRRQGHAVLSGALLGRVARRLLGRHPQALLLHAYENNSWERAAYAAARRAGRPAVGFLHCAVLPGHLKNFAADAEWAVRPHPARIVTTGPGASEVLERLGAYPPGMVAAGCALRDPPSAAATPAPEPRPGRVLVMLEGLITMAPLLDLARRAADARPDLTFAVRAHPDLPAARIARAAGFRMEDTALRESDVRDLSADVALAQVVVYQGTTAAITAGLAPRPLIRAAMDPRLDDDPLTGIADGKQVATTLGGFLEALDAALAAPPAEIEAAAARRAQAILRRWAEPTPERLAVFLPDPPAEGGGGRAGRADAG
jgi:hypothetical protein